MAEETLNGSTPALFSVQKFMALGDHAVSCDAQRRELGLCEGQKEVRVG